MTLRTSSNKKLNPAFNMFKYTLKRNIGVLLLITACALLISPGYAVMHIKETLKNLGYELTVRAILKETDAADGIEESLMEVFGDMDVVD